MNRMRLAISVGIVAGSAGVLSAQTGSTDYSWTDEKAVKNKAMLLTGCVAESGEAGHYLLTNAMMTGDHLSSTTGTAGMEGSVKDASMEHGLRYELKGENLKAHVGHKVEVTGTTNDGKTNKKDTNGSITGGTKDGPATLTVKSVKMLSTTCP